MVRRRTGLGLALAGVLAAAAPAVAQPAEGDFARKEGDYGGVNADGTQRPPDGSARPARPPARKTLLWVGFTSREGGASELFLRAADAFTVSQRLEGTTLVVVLEGLKGLARNTRRPLDTRFFETSLARVTARKVGARRARKGVPGHAAGVEIRIAFKDARDAREASVRSDTGADKMFYAYLGFAAPTEKGQIPESVARPQPSMEDPDAE